MLKDLSIASDVCNRLQERFTESCLSATWNIGFIYGVSMTFINDRLKKLFQPVLLLVHSTFILTLADNFTVGCQTGLSVPLLLQPLIKVCTICNEVDSFLELLQ